MASTLRFSVEVAADQATQALNVLTQSFNQAGINAKSALLGVGNGGRAAGKAVEDAARSVSAFKEQLSRGRETAMFFTSALSELGPGGRTAQMALSGVAGAMLGGGGVIFALEAARVAIRLITDAIAEEDRAHKAAAEAAAKHAASLDKITASWRSYAITTQGKGMAGSASKYLDEHRAAQQKLNDLLIQQTDLEAELAAGMRTDESQFQWGGFFGTGGRKGELKAKLEEVRTALQRAREEMDNLRAGYEGIGVSADAAAAGIAKVGAAASAGAGARGGVDVDRLVQDYLRQREAGRRAVDFKGVVGTEALGAKFLEATQADVARKAAAEAEIERQAQEAAAKAQELTTQIVTTWSAGLAQMLATTDFSARSMTQIFAQMMQQMIVAALPSSLGPWGAVLGAFTGGLTARLPRAHGGWDIPKGLGEVPMIGKGGEMMLGEREADVVRSLARAGGPAGAGITVNVNGAMDALSVERVLVGNEGALARANRKMRRRMRG